MCELVYDTRRPTYEKKRGSPSRAHKTVEITCVDSTGVRTVLGCLTSPTVFRVLIQHNHFYPDTSSVPSPTYGARTPASPV